MANIESSEDDFHYVRKPSHANNKSTLFAVNKDKWDMHIGYAHSSPICIDSPSMSLFILSATDFIPVLCNVSINWLQLALGCKPSHCLSTSLQQELTSPPWLLLITSNTGHLSPNSCIPISYHHAATSLLSGCSWFKTSLRLG